MIFFRKAVLVIHGFAGGTYDQENLANYLERRSFLDVYTFTLPGHDKRVFKTIEYTEWINSCEEKIKILIEYGYKDIYLIGHSMGGVIASFLATKYKCVKKLVLVAPAFEHLASHTSKNTLDKIKVGIEALKKNDKGNIDKIFKTSYNLYL